jgi:hypothetical protein
MFFAGAIYTSDLLPNFLKLIRTFTFYQFFKPSDKK